MIKRIIENEYKSSLEVLSENGKVRISVRTMYSMIDFEFDNDEDIHCFISELQSAMLRAREEKKFAVDTGEYKLVDPIDLKYFRENFESCKIEIELCNCGKPMFTGSCTRLGCDNYNVFGVGTVDTTSNGTE